MIIVDVETTALDKNCIVLSIGAINFNPDGPLSQLKDAPKFHIHINPLQQLKQGRSYDLGTIKWIHSNEPEVVDNAFKSAYSPHELEGAFKAFVEWLTSQSGFDGNVHVRGVDFEGSIIPNIAKHIGIRNPISFSGYNDVRTLIRDYLNTTSSYVTEDDFCEEAKAIVAPLHKHIAIDDCVIDAVQIIEGRRIRNQRIIERGY